MKKMLIAAAAVVVVAVIVVFVLNMAAKSKKLDAYMETLQINEVDLSAVADGRYSSGIDAGLILVRVEVTVKDHRITDIDLLEHKNGKGSAANAITGTIVAQQKISVDAVSGATLSSRVIQKAVETALKQGLQTP